MSIFRHLQHPIIRRSWRALLGVAALLVVAGLFGRSSSAEFQLPYVDTTTSAVQPVFRNVWAFHRGVVAGATTTYDRYEAYAVGIDASITDGQCPTHHADDCNGIFYFFDGSGWKKINAPFSSANNDGVPYALNAVAGQESTGSGTLAPFAVAGSDGRISWMSGYYGELGAQNQFQADIVDGRCGITPTPQTCRADSDCTNAGDTCNLAIGKCRTTTVLGSHKLCNSDVACTNSGDHCYVNNTTATTTYNAATEKRDFYAMDFAQDYSYSGLAGGQSGLVAQTTARNNGQDYWVVFRPTLRTPSGAAENLDFNQQTITSIRYANLTTAYVLTSTFPNSANDSDGYPNPTAHKCDGSQTSYLYKVSSSNLNIWTLLATQTGKCAYNLSISQWYNDPGTSLPLRNIIWIATSNGVYKYDEKTADGSTVATSFGTEAAGTENKSFYAITAVPDRGGTDVNLFANANFTNIAEGLYKADGWFYLESPNGYHHSSTCGSPSNVQNGDYGLVTNGVMVWPSAPYGMSGGVCTSLAGKYMYNTLSVSQRIELSTIEGQKFRLTGHVKVEFPTNNGRKQDEQGNSWAAAQGGIAIGCSGANNKYTTGEYINCTYSNRSLIFPDTGGSVDKDFDITFSLEDSSLSAIINNAFVTTTSARRFLTIGCEATFGAKATCSNLKLVEVSTPSTPSRDTALVIAAGDVHTNGMYVNADAMNPSSTFQAETVPATTLASTADTVNAMYGLGVQHMYAVGTGSPTTGGASGTMILDRTPSTLKGNIWLGASSNNSAVGNLSVSCVNDRSSNGDTLCQRNPESYGMSLNITTATGAVRTGTITGRGWLGATAQTGEALNLGQCTGALSNVSSTSNPYNLVGVCDTATRTCFSSTNHATGAAHSTKSCLSDFDCYGRCQRDNGFLCITDADCSVQNASIVDPGTKNIKDAQGSAVPLFAGNAASRLQCGLPGASALACTPIGWLSVDAKDATANGWVTPTGDPFGVQYNTLTVGCNTTLHTCRGNGASCSTDQDCNNGGDNHNSNYPIQNQGAHELSGWGRFMTLAVPQSSDPYSSATGWVKFRGETIQSSEIKPVTPGYFALQPDLSVKKDATPYLFACRDCQGSIAANNVNCAFCQDAANHSCTPTSTNSGTAGSQCFYVCEGTGTSAANPLQKCLTSSDCTNGRGTGICKAPGYCNANSSEPMKVCTSDTECGTGGTCQLGALCSTTNASCAAYGVNLDTENNQFYGYAWSQDLGWMNFQNVSYGGNRIIQTKLGDIYATGDIGQSGLAEPQHGSCNATYVISSAKTIIGFCSETNQKIENASAIPFASSENIYTNILGRFDLPGIATLTTATTNKYGSTVMTAPASLTSGNIVPWLSNTDTSGGPPRFRQLNTNTNGVIYGFSGKVYVIGTSGSTTNNYTIDSALQFGNSTNLAPTQDGSGAGVIIVNGNLLIKKDISYVADKVSDLRQLASLMIVVTGNLTIDDQVQNLVGAYYVQGKILTAPLKSSPTNTHPLKVSGLMIAGGFEFNRQFAGTIERPEPSELIVYDGRLQSNPMPGVVDFASALPNTALSTP